MDVTRTTFATWNGGRFVNHGESVDEARWVGLVRRAHRLGIRTFLTPDVYGCGQADQLLARGLEGISRDDYCLTAAIGHDFYSGQPRGPKGWPRFTQPGLRRPQDYGDYLLRATEKSLERCRVDRFDLVLLHNPDSTGFTSEHVWKGMERLREEGLAERLGIAPGPGNGYTLDMLECFHRFQGLIDWATVIFSPLESWPGSLIFRAAAHHGVRLLTRLVDAGGILHGDLQPGHEFGAADLRRQRPAGWLDSSLEKAEALRPIASRHGLSLMQLACTWNLQHLGIESVAPTLTEELGDAARPIEGKLDELAGLPEVRLSDEEFDGIRRIGDNTGSAPLKGASLAHQGPPTEDSWPVTPGLAEAGARWSIDPALDLASRS